MAMALLFRRNGLAVVAGMLLGVLPGTAQTPAAGVPPQNAAHATVARKHPRKTKLAAVPETAPEQTPPPAPPAPNWPVNSHAERANVTWDGRDLSVKAANSTLQQILHDVSTATGLKVEGLGGGDQRIYGAYGPGAARDVLSQLLEGSGYNILMIGDKGEGTPRTLVLTAKARGAGAKPVQARGQEGQDNQADEDISEEPEQPEVQPEPPLNRPFGGPAQGPGGRAPQEILQELQQRQLIQQQQQDQQLQQQQIEQQQQLQQQQEQPPPPQPDGTTPQPN